MTHEEWATYHNDVVRSEKMLKENNNEVSMELAMIFRAINCRKFNAEMYDRPYVSVFGEV
jgi:hypothetical protein